MARLVAVFAGLFIAAVGISQADGWKIEMIDQSGPGQYSSMRIDKDGNVHLTYVVVDNNKYPLRYAFWDRNLKRWFIMTVAEGAGACSLVLDSKQRPHIAYTDFGGASGAKLRYVFWNGNAWQREPVDLNSDIIGYYSAIALDGHDNPSISFYEYRGPVGTEIKLRMRVVMKREGHWEVATVDPEEGSGKYNSMISDAAGHLFLAYANVSANTAGMRFAYWDGKKWTREILDGPEQNNGEALGYSAFVTLDRQGNPHVSYLNESNSQVRYAVKKGGRWQIQIIDRLAASAYLDRNSVALDESDRPYVSYYDAGSGVLKIAHPEGKNWVAEIVDGRSSGYTNSMQIDRGTIWISYTDQASGGIRVAHRELTPTAAAPSANMIDPKRPQ